MSEPFTAAAITAGVLANIATRIVEHHAQALERAPLVGRMLKWAGLVEPNFEERVRDTVSKALALFFQKYPHHQLTGVLAFLSDPAVARQIGGYILDRKGINTGEIQEALDRHLRSDPLSQILLQQRGLDPEGIVPHFLDCYRQVLGEQLSVPQMALLLEVLEQSDAVIEAIRSSEERLRDYISSLLQTTLSPQALMVAYRAGRTQLAKDLADEMDSAGLVKPNEAIRTIQARLQPLPPLFSDGLCKGRHPEVAPDQYFVSHGFDAEALTDWRETLTGTLAHASGAQETLRPYFAGDKLLAGHRLCGICEKLCATRFSIFLLPASQDRNVYLELGIAIALGVPFLLIQHHEATIPPVLAGLARYVKGGLFRTMRRELAPYVEEYDFGVVRFVADLPAGGKQTKYLIGAGGLPDDEDFEASISEGISAMYPHLEGVPLNRQLESEDTSEWMLEQLAKGIHSFRFGIYRVDEECSATTFLALGICLGMSRPFLMVRKAKTEVPLDLEGISIYQFQNFAALRRDIVARHRAFFEKHK